ncbi:class I SAM-dependent methyltransferase [Spongiactinospora sp. TRM90649]|uniref:class I SAM-dependent methyltransferase n=1 Tax=Spongiactinospora sp. TRM90649 TaxID=3031114 RepID=UPI0023F74C6F|nr:class I SAM-dependent methyltransferase [Spongiactinospora sp. TRM90649]MDF5751138.1 class I SAM-dependent methyltransferase [Spongiactinospora sp. TRM90649]
MMNARAGGPAGWDEEADRLAAESLAEGDPTGWFERLYAAGERGAVTMPWDRAGPRPLLARWARERDADGAGRRALVVGCGLGHDAEYVCSLGYTTDAFDVSPTAVRTARARFPASAVRYVVADLLAPPAEWQGAFDLVVEVYTVQALPREVRPEAIANVRRMVGPGGTLVVVATADDPATAHVQGPPWPLVRSEVESFADDGLGAVSVESLPNPDAPTVNCWLAEFQRR